MFGIQDPGALMGRAALSCIRFALFFVPLGVAGQQGAALGVLGGVTQYDLGGVGIAPAVSFRATSPLDRRVVVEGAFTYFSYSSQAKETTWHVLPEAQVQVQWVRWGLRPFFGLGMGASRASSDNDSATDLTFSVAGGARRRIAQGWTLTGELRVRSIDPWAGTTADWGLGILGPLGGSRGEGAYARQGNETRVDLPAMEGQGWRIPAAVGFVVGAATMYAWLQSGGSTSLCDRSRNQDAMGRGECFALTVSGGAVGAGLGVLTARLLRSRS